MNKLLSEQYRRVLETEHSRSEWGVTGWCHAPYVHKILTRENIKTLLDYGAGRGSLGHWLDKNTPGCVIRQEYEPGIPQRAHMPAAAEIVTCIDVMEHIEPDCVVGVLDHIQSLAQRCVYFNISLRPAGRILSDGRNAHLTIQPIEWWKGLLEERWLCHDLIEDPDHQSFNWLGLVRA
jgi:hypothetical protein